MLRSMLDRSKKMAGVVFQTKTSLDEDGKKAKKNAKQIWEEVLHVAQSGSTKSMRLNKKIFSMMKYGHDLEKYQENKDLRLDESLAHPGKISVIIPEPIGIYSKDLHKNGKLNIFGKAFVDLLYGALLHGEIGGNARILLIARMAIYFLKIMVNPYTDDDISIPTIEETLSGEFKQQSSKYESSNTIKSLRAAKDEANKNKMTVKAEDIPKVKKAFQHEMRKLIDIAMTERSSEESVRETLQQEEEKLLGQQRKPSSYYRAASDHQPPFNPMFTPSSSDASASSIYGQERRASQRRPHREERSDTPLRKTQSQWGAAYEPDQDDIYFYTPSSSDASSSYDQTRRPSQRRWHEETNGDRGMKEPTMRQKSRDPSDYSSTQHTQSYQSAAYRSHSDRNEVRFNIPASSDDRKEKRPAQREYHEATQKEQWTERHSHSPKEARKSSMRFFSEKPESPVMRRTQSQRDISYQTSASRKGKGAAEHQHDQRARMRTPYSDESDTYERIPERVNAQQDEDSAKEYHPLIDLEAENSGSEHERNITFQDARREFQKEDTPKFPTRRF